MAEKRVYGELYAAVPARASSGTRRGNSKTATSSGGLANKETAWKLRIFERRFKKDVSTIRDKLAPQSRTQTALARVVLSACTDRLEAHRFDGNSPTADNRSIT